MPTASLPLCLIRITIESRGSFKLGSSILLSDGSRLVAREESFPLAVEHA